MELPWWRDRLWQSVWSSLGIIQTFGKTYFPQSNILVARLLSYFLFIKSNTLFRKFNNTVESINIENSRLYIKLSRDRLYLKLFA